MKEITFEKAAELMEAASAVRVDEQYIVIPDKEGERVRMDWEDDEGQQFAMVFHHDDNERVKVSGANLLVRCDDGTMETITLLHPWDVEKEL